MSQKSTTSPSCKVKRSGWFIVYPAAVITEQQALAIEESSNGDALAVHHEWEEPAEPEAQTTAPAIVFYPAGSLGAMQGETE